MTGRENDREGLWARIQERESLAEEYRAALRREKAARQSPLRRSLSRIRSRIRRAAKKTGLFGSAAPGPAPPEGDLALDRQKADERRDLYFRQDRIAVYTALFGSYDVLREPLLCPDNIDYYVFTDQPVPENSLWRLMDTSLIPPEYRGDPVMSNRWCKMHPHLLFPEYRYSVYIDANVWPLSDLTPLTAGLDRYPTAMFRHKRRDCVYEEVRACIRQKKADPGSLRAHGAALRTHGVPEHWGLLEASVIGRKHADPRCAELMEAWWAAFCAASRRDQISLIDCLWQAGIEPGRIGTLGDNLQKCDLFLQLPHPGPGEPEQPRDLGELLARIGKT